MHQQYEKNILEEYFQDFDINHFVNSDLISMLLNFFYTIHPYLKGATF